MPFEKGHNKIAGRKKGVENTDKRKIREAIKELVRSAGVRNTYAQSGFGPEWVRGPHSFHVEPGAEELVSIIPKGRSGAIGSQQPIIVNTTIKPIVIPGPDGGYLIKFLQEAAADERLTLNPKAIRSQ